MIDLKGKTLEEAVQHFAYQVLFELYHYDLDALDRLIDQTDLPLQEQFPDPGDGVRYADPDEIPDYHFELEQREDGGYNCYLDIPFSDTEYRCAIADFSLDHVRESLSVHLHQVAPS